jgi:manganese/iron transport system permease protein
MTIFETIQRGWDVLLRAYDWYLIQPIESPILLPALQAAIIVGVLSGVVGSLVVVRGMSFFADALAHTILPGVAFMFQRQTAGDNIPGFTRDNPLFWGGLGAGILSAFLIGFLTRQNRIRNDTAIGVVFAGMFALGIAMVSSVDNYFGDLTHILFGQIFDVTPADLELTLIFGAIVLAIVILFYKEFLIISFDTVLAQTLNMPTEFFRYLLLILMAITIVVSLQIVGIALMLALLITPAATASLMTHRLNIMMVLAALVGAASSIIGFYVSFHFDVAAGPSIVLTATALFVFVYVEQMLISWGVLVKRAGGERVRQLMRSTATRPPDHATSE